MGYYVNIDSKGKELLPFHKTNQLLKDGGKIADAKFQENLICVVENGFWDAAAYCYSEKEFNELNSPSDHRPKTWLTHPEAKKLSEYEK